MPYEMIPSSERLATEAAIVLRFSVPSFDMSFQIRLESEGMSCTLVANESVLVYIGEVFS